MAIINIGNRFPIEGYLNNNGISVSILNTRFFDIFISMSNPTPSEIKDFNYGTFILSMYKTNNTPFIICEYGCFRCDVNINIHKQTSDFRSKWINGKSDVINIYLVDANSGIVLSIKEISLPFAQDIRDMLKKQPRNADSIIVNAMNSTTTKEMITRRGKYFKF